MHGLIFLLLVKFTSAIMKGVICMNKSKKSKIVLIIMAVLAIIDLSDIIAKGQMLGFFRRIAPDACTLWDTVSQSQRGATKIRFSMIDRVSDYFKNH